MLRYAVGVFVFVIDAQKVCLGGNYGLLQLGLVDDQDAQVALLGDLIQRLVGLVGVAQFVGSGLHFGAVFVRHDFYVLDLDLIVAVPVFPLDFLGSDHGAFHGDAAHFG